ncbi:MAG TPA: alpha/beta fold hydrolase [Pyrinomonadaceae bacterium]|nr:alpha/beta fold hydrolase [Pyrinomonadaceae bacterium]
MKLKLTLLLFLFAVPVHAQQTIEGRWQGALLREGAVQVIIVDFTKSPSGGLMAAIETPDLVTSEPRSVAATYQDGMVRFDAPFGKATLAVDPPMGEMIGTIEATPSIQIHLKRAFKPAAIPFNTADVQFRNGNVTLAGTLVTPATAGPHPAIVWIHGRGKSGRNDFRGFARIMAQRGIASLIYDKRGVGQSTGDHDKSGMYDFAGDALAAVEFLATRSEIDRQQIGIHGNSAGGWVAAIVANRTRIPLAFIITTVGPADSVRDQQIHVAEYSMRQSGIDFSVAEYAAAREHMGLVQSFAYTAKGWEALRASVEKAKPTRWARFVDLPEAESYEDIVWVRLNQYDPAEDLRKIKTPFLALYGGSDYVVPPEENVKKLEKYLTEAGNSDFKIAVFPGADHGLTIPNQLRRFAPAGSNTGQPNNGGADKSYWLFRKRAPGAVDLTVDWLLQRVKLKTK